MTTMNFITENRARQLMAEVDEYNKAQMELHSSEARDAQSKKLIDNSGCSIGNDPYHMLVDLTENMSDELLEETLKWAIQKWKVNLYSMNRHMHNFFRLHLVPKFKPSHVEITLAWIDEQLYSQEIYHIYDGAVSTLKYLIKDNKLNTEQLNNLFISALTYVNHSEQKIKDRACRVLKCIATQLSPEQINEIFCALLLTPANGNLNFTQIEILLNNPSSCLNHWDVLKTSIYRLLTPPEIISCTSNDLFEVIEQNEPIYQYEYESQEIIESLQKIITVTKSNLIANELVTWVTHKLQDTNNILQGDEKGFIEINGTEFVGVVKQGDINGSHVFSNLLEMLKKSNYSSFGSFVRSSDSLSVNSIFSNNNTSSNDQASDNSKATDSHQSKEERVALPTGGLK